MLLRFFSKDKLWKELLRRETFDVSFEIESRVTWQNVFHRTPEIKQFMKRREALLLKSVALNEKSNEFVLGQIAENRLWQGFDVPMQSLPKVESPNTVTERISKSAFLAKWKHANTPETSTQPDAPHHEDKNAE